MCVPSIILLFNKMHKSVVSVLEWLSHNNSQYHCLGGGCVEGFVKAPPM